MAARKKPEKARTNEELLEEAQGLIWDAWELTDRRAALALARKALRLSPDCADAYVMFAQAARTRAQEMELYRKGVEAGERALGKVAFKRDVGHFWKILETRPYMRARAGLAECLWEVGPTDEAIEHWRDMLRLNPGDNIGIRYVLAARLLYLDRDAEAAAVIKKYKGDGCAYFLWTEAILLFRALGDHPKSRRALDAALATNPHVPAYLFEPERIPLEKPDQVTWGGPDEAAECAYELKRPWRVTKGALEWLAARIGAERPALLN